MSETGPGTADALPGDLQARMLRVARLVTGSREGADEVLRRTLSDVLPDAFTRPSADGGNAASNDRAWRALVALCEQARCVEPSSLPPLTPSSTQAEHLARALASLPLRKRLVVALHHQSGLSTDELGEVLGLPEQQAAALVSASQAHLQAIARALGDTLRLS